MLGNDRAPLKPRVKILLPGPLLRLFPCAGAETLLNVDGVRDMLVELDAMWPGMRDRLVDTTPGIRCHIAIFVDGQRATLDTPFQNGSEIYILTAISGG